MASGFQAFPLSVRELLSGQAVLHVPDYQRPYSWTTAEAEQLLDDIALAATDARASSTENGGYFLGTMLLMARKDDSQVRALASSLARPDSRDIVDGQQRIVTLTILFAVIRDLIAERGGPEIASLQHALWVDRGASCACEPRVRLRGREADFLRSYVQEPGASAIMPPDDDLLPSEARIIAVRERFVEGLLDVEADALRDLAEYLLDRCYLAVITTSTIDRAHRIFSVLNNRGRPLARNDILKAQILGGIPESVRAAYVPAWADLEQRLGSEFDGLFSHLRVIAGYHRDRIISGIAHQIEAAGGPQRFFDDVLEPYARIYEAMQMRPANAGGSEAALARYLTYLGWLGSEDWVPAFMLLWHTVKGDRHVLVEFARRLDRLAYCLRLLGLGADKRQARFSAVLSAVRRGTWRDGPASPFEVTRDEVRNIQYNLRNLHSRSQLTCKLVLLRLNDVIAGAPQFLDPAEYTVEHVLPQKPARTSHWRQWYPSADEREACTQSLGNLVLVTRSQNDRARNMDLARKLEVYFADGVEAALPITRELAGIAEWRPSQIIERESRLLTLIQNLWDIDTSRAADTGSRSSSAPARISAGRTS
jgi:hypothetical protein